MDRRASAADVEEHTELMRRFYECWRKLRRGEIIQKIAPQYLGIATLRLTTSESDVLQVIPWPAGCTMSEIARATEMDPGNITRTVAQLEHEGYVDRKAARADARSVVVALTKEGHKAAALLNRRRQLIYEVAMSELTPKQRRELVNTLETVINSLKFFTTSAAQVVLSEQSGSLTDGPP
jgi:DNA-binding MarR family transcriptional regulator